MGEVPDHAPIFEEPPRETFGTFCFHESYTVNVNQRTITCNRCHAAVDAFAIVQQWAQRTRVRENMDDRLKELRASIRELERVERNVKSRTRTAKKKDVDAAVAKAVAREKKAHEQAVCELRGIRRMIEESLRRLGADRGFDTHAEDESRG